MRSLPFLVGLAVLAGVPATASPLSPSPIPGHASERHYVLELPEKGWVRIPDKELARLDAHAVSGMRSHTGVNGVLSAKDAPPEPIDRAGRALVDDLPHQPQGGQLPRGRRLRRRPRRARDGHRPRGRRLLAPRLLRLQARRPAVHRARLGPQRRRRGRRLLLRSGHPRPAPDQRAHLHAVPVPAHAPTRAAATGAWRTASTATSPTASSSTRAAPWRPAIREDTILLGPDAAMGMIDDEHNARISLIVDKVTGMDPKHYSRICFETAEGIGAPLEGTVTYEICGARRRDAPLQRARLRVHPRAELPPPVRPVLRGRPVHPGAGVVPAVAGGSHPADAAQRPRGHPHPRARGAHRAAGAAGRGPGRLQRGRPQLVHAPGRVPRLPQRLRLAPAGGLLDLRVRRGRPPAHARLGPVPARALPGPSAEASSSRAAWPRPATPTTARP